MLRIEEVSERNIQHVLNYLKLDVLRHVFAFYDIQYERENTKMYVAMDEGGCLKGYILIYNALTFPSAVPEGDSDAVEKLLEYVPEDKVIMHVPPNLLSTVKRRFPNAKDYTENWMLIKKGKARFFKSNTVRRLLPIDAEKLANLLSSRSERSAADMEKYRKLAEKMPLYGVFVDEKLVSYASSFIQLPQVWMIGGVFTHPDHRDRGYATLATSAITEHALEHADAAALFVRADNRSAIRVYEKIGYRKIGEKMWIDVGTGLKP